MTEKHSPQTILLAEDDPVVRKSTATFLHEKGYQILEAEDGKIALELLRSRHPDALITDLRMPNIDGIELLQSALQESPDMPAIILSGMGTMNDAIKAVRIGVFDYLTKPVEDMQKLADCLKKALIHGKKIQDDRNNREQIGLLARKMEEQQNRESMILHAKKELERTIDAMSEMVAIIDKEHRIIRINSPLQKKIGKPYQEIVGHHCYSCFPTCETLHDQCPHTKTMTDGLLHRIEAYDKEQDSYLEISTVPYTDADGSLIGSVHIARDITEQRKAEKDKEKLQSQLLHAQKMESVGLLAAGIAHEINTPTQFIGTNIDFIDEAATDITAFMKVVMQIAETAPPEIGDKLRSAMEESDWEYLAEELPRAITQSRDGVKRVSTIVRAMKEFSHPGSREKVPQSLNQIIKTTMTVARNEWKYVAEIVLDLDPELPPVPLLADEMGQVILNMLTNASHAIAEKLGDNPEGALGTITLSTKKIGNTIELCIGDSGAGMPEEVQAHIFDPFFTTKGVGKGTGQGLAISHGVIVDKHQGSISVESTPGEGTLFRILLPL